MAATHLQIAILILGASGQRPHVMTILVALLLCTLAGVSGYRVLERDRGQSPPADDPRWRWVTALPGRSVYALPESMAGANGPRLVWVERLTAAGPAGVSSRSVELQQIDCHARAIRHAPREQRPAPSQNSANPWRAADSDIDRLVMSSVCDGPS